jgi:uncharacterized cupredoxin-like copper-binding protein
LRRWLALALLLLVPESDALRTIAIHEGTRADGSMYIEPREVRVPQGERITFTVVNDDASTPHDWALLEYDGHDLEIHAKGGETRSLTFTATVDGTFRIVCQVVGHKQKGMEGAFVVEKASAIPGLPAVALLALLAIAAARTRRR